MRAVCSGTGRRGCCGWSDIAKPPEITAPTPLSTFRPTHSPTVSAPKWDSSDRCGLERSPTPFPMPFGTEIWLRQYCFMLCGTRARRALLLSVRVRDGQPPDGTTREQVPGPRDLPAAVLVADRHHRLALASYAHENGCVHRGRPDRPPLLRT